MGVESKLPGIIEDLNTQIDGIWDCDRKERTNRITEISKNLKTETKSTNDWFFNLDKYTIRRLVFEGLALDSVTKLYNDRFSKYHKKNEMKKIDLSKLLAAYEGEDDKFRSLKGSRIRVISHKPVKGFVAKDLARRVGRFFKRQGLTLFNFFNFKSKLSSVQLDSAKKIIAESANILKIGSIKPKQFENDEARHLLCSLYLSTKKEEAIDRDYSMFLNTNTGEVELVNKGFTLDLDTFETGRTILECASRLINSGEYQVRLPDGRTKSVFDLLRRFSTTAWGEAYLKKMKEHIPEEYSRYEDTLDISEFRSGIENMPTFSSKIRLLTNYMRRGDKEIRLQTRKQLLEWVMMWDESKEVPREEMVRHLPIFQKLGQVSALNPDLKEEVKRLRVFLLQFGEGKDYIMHSYKLEVEKFFNEKTEKDSGFKEAFIAKMEHFANLCKEIKGTEISDIGLNDIIDTANLFRQKVKEYVEHPDHLKAQNVPAALRKVLAAVVCLDVKVNRLPEIAAAPRTVLELVDETGAPEKQFRVLKQAYKEFGTTLANAQENFAKLEPIYRLVIKYMSDPKDKLIIEQALFDLQIVTTAFSRFEQATNQLDGSVIPEQEELQKIIEAARLLENQVVVLGRLGSLGRHIEDKTIEYFNSNNKLQEEFKDLGYKNSTEVDNVLAVVHQQMTRFLNPLAEIKKNEIDEAFNKIIGNLHKELLDNVPLYINEKISPIMEDAIEQLTAEELAPLLPAAQLRLQLGKYHSMLSTLKKNQKLQLFGGTIIKGRRRMTGKPQASQQAYERILDTVAQALDMGILQFESDKKRVSLDKLLQTGHPWVDAVLEQNEALRLKRSECDQRYQAARERYLASDRYKLETVKAIQLPEKYQDQCAEVVRIALDQKSAYTNMLKENKANLEKANMALLNLETQLENWRGAGERDTDYGEYGYVDVQTEKMNLESKINRAKDDIKTIENAIEEGNRLHTESVKKKEEAENAPEQLAMIQKLCTLEHPEEFKAIELEGIRNPMEFLENYRKEMSTDILFDHIDTALRNPNLPDAQKETLLSFVLYWVFTKAFQVDEEFKMAQKKLNTWANIEQLSERNRNAIEAIQRNMKQISKQQTAKE